MLEGINPSLAAELAVTLSEGDGTQDNTDGPQHPPTVASEPEPDSRLSGLLEVRTKVVVEEVCCTTKELNKFANSFKQNSEEIIWEWIFKIWDNGET